MSNVIALPSRDPRASIKLRADVPAFDPTNVAHLRARETIWTLGNAEMRARLDGGRDHA